MLRRSVRAAGVKLTRADFPAFDNAQRPGLDGQVETTVSIPWIPASRSLWESGCNRQPAHEANNDYSQRVRTVTPDERRDTASVFAASRNGWRKGEWAAEKIALKEMERCSRL